MNLTATTIISYQKKKTSQALFLSFQTTTQPFDFLSEYAIIRYTILCRGAGIGIQDSLKNYCPLGLKGSSPFPGKNIKPAFGRVFYFCQGAHQLLGARKGLEARSDVFV